MWFINSAIIILDFYDVVLVLHGKRKKKMKGGPTELVAVQ
jgi:hypothetical protein